MCELDAYDAWFDILFPLDTCGKLIIMLHVGTWAQLLVQVT